MPCRRLALITAPSGKPPRSWTALLDELAPMRRGESEAPTQSVINVEELKRSYAEGLQVQVNRGRMSAMERSNLLTKFDKDHGPAPSQDQALQEARQLAAEARSHEAAEHAKAYEIEGPER